MSTMIPEVGSNKSTNSENKKTTMANFPNTEAKPTLTISQNLENTKSANTPIKKTITDKDEASGLATNHFLSFNAFSVMFVPFILNA